MHRLLIVFVVASSLAVVALLLSGAGDNHLALSPTTDFPALGGPGLRSRDLHYVCTDDRNFRLLFLDIDERSAVLADETSGLRFDLRPQLSTAGTQYGDGTILVSLAGTAATVVTGNVVYFDDCQLRTKLYYCADRNAFEIDILHTDQREAIITDKTNQKKFTLYAQPFDRGQRFSDGVIFVELEGSSGFVTVDGNLYFKDCHRLPNSPDAR